MAQNSPELMNTRQAAAYLGINEKKIYALAKAGKIPATRVTGKWTFPRNLIDAWIERSAAPGSGETSAARRPRLLAAGSDDPSLAVLRELFEQRTGTGWFFLDTVGSRGGLEALRAGVADLATSHLLDPASGEYNVPVVKSVFGAGAVVVQLFYRHLGLIVAPGNPLRLRSIRDLTRAKVRVVNRQPGSGTRVYLDETLRRQGIDGRRLKGYDSAVTTHLEVGLRVLRGEADAGLGVLTAARMLGLDFVPLARERFDAVFTRDGFFRPEVQALLNIVGSSEFRARLNAIGGYDCAESGRIVATV